MPFSGIAFCSFNLDWRFSKIEEKMSKNEVTRKPPQTNLELKSGINLLVTIPIEPVMIVAIMIAIIVFLPSSSVPQSKSSESWISVDVFFVIQRPKIFNKFQIFFLK